MAAGTGWDATVLGRAIPVHVEGDVNARRLRAGPAATRVGSEPSHGGKRVARATVGSVWPAAPVQFLLMRLSRVLLVGWTKSLTTAPLTLATMICPTSS